MPPDNTAERRPREGGAPDDAANVSTSVTGTRGAAAELARRGWYVFPCLPGTKRPAPARWEQRACADPEKVARFWPGPLHNIGVACGPSRLVVVDLDTHGTLPDDWRLPGIRDGRDVLAQLCEWAGQPWPGTYMVATASGGWHLYYQAPDGDEIRNSAGKIAPLIDVRGRGGQVLGAGSVVNGRPYGLLDGRPPEPLPRWITRMLRPATLPIEDRIALGKPRLTGLMRAVEAAPEGQRNDVLYWAACRAVAEGGDPGELLAAALAAGLPESEAGRTIRSAMSGAR